MQKLDSPAAPPDRETRSVVFIVAMDDTPASWNLE